MSEIEAQEDSVFWSADHEHYEGTELTVEPISEPWNDDEPDCFLGIVDVIEGKRIGHYGPKVIENDS